MTKRDETKPAETTEEIIKILNAHVRIGLRNQGLMDTVVSMLLSAESWETIGQAIHWDPTTAASWFAREAAITIAEQRKEIEAQAMRYERQIAELTAERDSLRSRVAALED